MSHSDWNDERIKMLRNGHAQRLSFAVIAEFINIRTGSTFSRNACTGKAFRIGLDHRSAQIKSAREAPSRAKRKTTNSPCPIPAAFGSLKEVESTPTPADFLGITFFDLKQHHCRYPRGGNDGTPILYCGQPKIEGGSYCAACHARCHAGRVYLGRAA